ncbi:hypothetical protein AAC387_Pa04g0386 [Persea americana]
MDGSGGASANIRDEIKGEDDDTCLVATDREAYDYISSCVDALPVHLCSRLPVLLFVLSGMVDCGEQS